VSTKIKAQRKVNDTKIFVDKVETQLREKPIRGSQTQEFHYSEDKARYKTVTLTCTFPTRFTYLKGSSMELLTLEPASKIDFDLQHSKLEKRLQKRYHVSEL